MSTFDSEPSDTFVKLLLVGPHKLGKTHYAMQAAEAGFKVCYMDGDVARPTLNKLSLAAKKRLYYMGVGDYIDANGNYCHHFADSVKEFVTARGQLVWNQTKQRTFNAKEYEPTDHVAIIKPSMMGWDTVWIFDSWSSYAMSVKSWKAESLGEDLGEVEKFGQDLYAGASNKGTQTLVMIQACKTNVIVIAHTDEYTRLRKPVGAKFNVKQNEMTIAGVDTIPTSISRPHGATMGKHFTDMGYMEFKGQNRRINFQGREGQLAGGHLEGRNLSAEEGSFLELMKAAGARIPTQAEADSPIEWLQSFGPGEYEPPSPKALIAASTPKGNTLKPADSAGKPAMVGLSGLAGLGKKPSQPAS